MIFISPELRNLLQSPAAAYYPAPMPVYEGGEAAATQQRQQLLAPTAAAALQLRKPPVGRGADKYKHNPGKSAHHWEVLSIGGRPSWLTNNALVCLSLNAGGGAELRGISQ
jgi:hypothetical protein